MEWSYYTFVYTYVYMIVRIDLIVYSANRIMMGWA